MENIKVKPYPNYGITEECIARDIEPTSKPIHTVPPKEQKEALDFNVPKVMVMQFKSGENRFCRVGPVIESKGKKYFSVFPNPVHLFLDMAINAFKISENIKSENFITCGAKGKKQGDFIFLDIEADETHECYNAFLKQRTTSIIMLTTAVEAFLNYTIPNSFTYTNAKGESFNKEQIEKEMRFKDKLKDVLPLSLSRPDFWDNKSNERNTLYRLNAIRNTLIHLKTNASQDFEAYFEEMNDMTKFNMQKAIDTVIDFMNHAEPGFVQLNPQQKPA